MNRLLWAVVLTFSTSMASGQRYKLKDFVAGTPQGSLLAEIVKEEDNGKKTALLEKFLSQFPQDQAAPWAMYQIIPAYTKAGEFDKAMAIGEKMMALDPGDPESAHNTLKAAEGKKDPDAIRKWAGITSRAARKAAAEPQPSDASDVENWKNRVDYARQVDIYTEYSLYAAALAVPDPKKKIELAEALEAQNPNSQYIPQVSGAYFVALQQTGDQAKAVAVAEKSLAKDPTNEDMLLVVANHYMTKKDAGKVLDSAGKLVALLNTKPKPAGVGDADWDKKKNQMLGVGNWMLGVTYMDQNKLVEADKAFRAALPLIGNTPDLLAPALFHLGVANYKLGDTAKPDKVRIADALKFSQQCATLNSPYQAQAQTNVGAIKKKYALK